MSPPTLRLALLALFVAALTDTARAGPIWGYRNPSNTSVLSPGEAAGLTFPNTEWTDMTGGGHITVTPVQSWSVAAALNPDHVFGEFYTFGIEVKDYASGKSGTFDFSGLINGTLWKEGTALTNSFTGETAKALDLGALRYTLALDAFEAPTGFGEAGAGSITADVTLTSLSETLSPAPSSGEVAEGSQTPEPAGIVLAGVGLCTVGLFRRRRASSVAIAEPPRPA